MNDSRDNSGKPGFDSSKLMASVADSIFDGLVVIDGDFNIVYANERFAAIYGKKPDQMVGSKCSEVVGFDHCQHSCPHRDILERRSDYSGHSLYCQRHQAGPYCVSASPLLDKDGKVVGVVELYRDMKQLGVYIGSLEETNTALQLEKNRLRRMLDEMADGYYEATPDGRITSVNDKLKKLLGKSAPELVGRQCSDAICGESCETDCPLKWAIEHKQNVINSHQTMVVGGKRLPHDKSIILIEDTDGQIASVLGVVTNVSEALSLRKKAVGAMEYHRIVTKNQAMRDMMSMIEEAAPTDAPVLIAGETGTGKELVAMAIQRLSRRGDKPFVKINCSALTESLLESELFGHVRGAFTGAVANYAGKFKSADKGTIFLDEVEEMSPGLQAKLLRVLEAQEFEPVGSNRLEKVNVRIIAATNTDLAEVIQSGGFRSDLYYRLNVIRIDVPPLRRRTEDIPVLIDHRLTHLREKYGKEISSVSTRGLAVLVDYDWPGNVRQLFGTLEYAFLKCRTARIERKDLPPEIYASGQSSSAVSDQDPEQERREIERLLEKYPNNRRRVAFALGISRTTLWRKMRELRIT